jgi:hypothetical protein
MRSKGNRLRGPVKILSREEVVGENRFGELSVLVRRVLAAMDPSQAVAGDATIEELIDANMARHRFNMTLLFGLRCVPPLWPRQAFTV